VVRDSRVQECKESKETKPYIRMLKPEAISIFLGGQVGRSATGIRLRQNASDIFCRVSL